MTPVLVYLQYFMHGTTIPRIQMMSLVPICVGVSMATVSSLEVNGMTGLFFGVMGILSTSVYQIWVKSEQKDLSLSPFQLLHNQAFSSIFLLFPIALLADYDLFL